MTATYQELIVWQRAMDLACEVYRLTASLPPDERFGLCAQLRRSAVSVPSNIAEGHGRETGPEFRSFLAIARGSLREIETQVLLGERLGLFSRSEAKPVSQLAVGVAIQLTRLMSTITPARAERAGARGPTGRGRSAQPERLRRSASASEPKP